MLNLFLLAGLGALVLAESGCPLSMEREEGANDPPDTYFLVSIDTPDTTFRNEVFFNWAGSDTDNDVVAFQYQLVQVDSTYYFSGGNSGTAFESIDPRNFTGAEQWSDRTTDDARTFSNLDDGFYELRARSIDSNNLSDPQPAEDRFVVFFDDVNPLPVITDPTTTSSRITTNSITFTFTASDESRNDVTLREHLEYQYQLRAESVAACNEHLSDVFTDWARFPAGDDEITVGNDNPTIYNDLITVGCGWIFTLRVRDPARNVGTVTHRVERIQAGP